MQFSVEDKVKICQLQLLNFRCFIKMLVRNIALKQISSLGIWMLIFSLLMQLVLLFACLTYISVWTACSVAGTGVKCLIMFCHRLEFCTILTVFGIYLMSLLFTLLHWFITTAKSIYNVVHDYSEVLWGCVTIIWSVDVYHNSTNCREILLWLSYRLITELPFRLFCVLVLDHESLFL